jgi:hypothetical protein
VVARLDDSGGFIEIYDILIGCGIYKEESHEVVAVEFAPS